MAIVQFAGVHALINTNECIACDICIVLVLEHSLCQHYAGFVFGHGALLCLHIARGLILGLHCIQQAAEYICGSGLFLKCWRSLFLLCRPDIEPYRCLDSGSDFYHVDTTSILALPQHELPKWPLA